MRITALLFLTFLTMHQVNAARPKHITSAAENSIKKGLAYLAKQQKRDGSWSGGRGSQTYPVTMTAMAGLALLAGGNTPVEGMYSKNVRRAVDYLLTCTNKNGLIAKGGGRPMYGHGFATLFLAQVYGMGTEPSVEKRIRLILTKGVQLTCKSQTKYGGWYYTPGSQSDEGSVTVTQMQALRACRNAGIKVPKGVIDKACSYIAHCQCPDGGIRYSYRQHGGRGLPAITAATVATMYNAGAYDHPAAKKALKYTKNQLQKFKLNTASAFGGHAFYSLLYAGQAMFLSGEANWNWFFPKNRDSLIKTQEGNGSWNDRSTGPVFGTSVALITLQLPYRRMPILQR